MIGCFIRKLAQFNYYIELFNGPGRQYFGSVACINLRGLNYSVSFSIRMPEVLTFLYVFILCAVICWIGNTRF